MLSIISACLVHIAHRVCMFLWLGVKLGAIKEPNQPTPIQTQKFLIYIDFIIFEIIAFCHYMYKLTKI